MTSQLDKALDALSRGWSVIPVDADTKKPLTPWKEYQRKKPTESTVMDWWGQHPDAAIGIVTGRVSDIAVLDIDVKGNTDGEASLKTLEQENGSLPQTPTVTTPSGGRHRYFRSPTSGIKSSAGKLGPGLDVRGEGGYIIGAGSVRSTGEGYEWVPGQSPEDVTFAELPEWLVSMLNNTGTGKTPSVRIPISKRNTSLTSIAGYLLNKGIGQDAMTDALMAINAKGLEEPLDEKEVRAISKSVSKYPKAKESPPTWVSMSNVVSQNVNWLIHPHIPKSKLTIIEGDPGIGKSYLILAIAAAMTSGVSTIPGWRSDKSERVLLCSSEDDLRDTIRPRLEDMGADVSKVLALDSPMVFDKNGLIQLEEVMRDFKPGGVFIDPLVGFMGPKLDLHRANAMRSFTSAISKLAEQYQCVFLAVMHLNKGGSGKPITRGLGSIDIAAAARSVLLVGADPDNPEIRAMVPIKNNLAKQGRAIGFSIGEDGLRWQGYSDLTAHQMLYGGEAGIDVSALEEAKSFLRQELEEGAREVNELLRDAKVLGISGRTLRRAKEDIGIQSKPIYKSGERGAQRWLWGLGGQDIPLAT